MIFPSFNVMIRPGIGGDVVFVGHHDDRLASLVESPQQGHDLVGRHGIQVAGRLVGQDDVRVVDQGPGDGHPLAFPAGELGRPMVHAPGEPGQFQHPGGLFQAGIRAAGEYFNGR